VEGRIVAVFRVKEGGRSGDRKPCGALRAVVGP
jgi:hypothetical protein